MKNLDELGFGPPDLNLPTGKCRNGHDWAENTLVSICKRGPVRTCITCREKANRKRADKRTGARHKLRGQVLKNIMGKNKKKKKKLKTGVGNMNTQPNSARTCRKCGTVEFSKKLCSPPLFQLGCRCGVGMDEALPWDEACDVWNAMDREYES